MGDSFLVQKLPSCLFHVSNHNPCFAQVITPIFSVMLSLLNSDDFSVKAFFPAVAFYAYFLSSFTAYLSFNFPWYFPEKSGNIYLLFRHISFNIQWILFVLTFFVELSFQAILFIRWFIRLFICISLFVYLFVCFFIWLFICSLFLYSFVLSFWAV